MPCSRCPHNGRSSDCSASLDGDSCMPTDQDMSRTRNTTMGAGGQSSLPGGGRNFHHILLSFLHSPLFSHPFSACFAMQTRRLAPNLKARFWRASPLQIEPNTWPRRSIKNISRKRRNSLTQHCLSHRAGRTARGRSMQQGFGCHRAKRISILHPWKDNTGQQVSA